MERNAPSFPFEVLVVANPPQRNCKLDTSRLSYPVQLLTSEAGANHARRTGLRAAKAPIVLFLDDDCWIEDPQLLETHFHLHAHHPDISGFGGLYALPPRSNRWGRAYHHLQNRWLWESRLPYGGQLHLLGGHASYKKPLFDEENFDPGWIFGGTETEFQLRLAQRKRKLSLQPDLKVFHEGHLSLAAFLRKAFLQGVGQARIRERHPSPISYRFFDQGPSRPESFPFWIYRCAFREGRACYQKTGATRFSNSQIFFQVLQVFFRPRTYAETLWWRNLRNFFQLLDARIMSRSKKSSPTKSD